LHLSTGIEPGEPPDSSFIYPLAGGTAIFFFFAILFALIIHHNSNTALQQILLIHQSWAILSSITEYLNTSRTFAYGKYIWNRSSLFDQWTWWNV